jgi:general secretion pathway protein J
MTRRKTQSGVTLMELLIAVTLFSLISVGLLLALRIGLNTYGKAQNTLMANRRVAGAQRILEAEIEGMVPVLAPCGVGSDGNGGAKTPFFQGEAQTIRLVSTFSLQEGWRGRPQILEIFVVPGDQSGVRLVVNEIPYMHPFQAGSLCNGDRHYLPVSSSSRSFVLADKLASCRFLYLQQSENKIEPPVWTPMFRGKSWPIAVRIQMAPQEPDFSRLQPITMTAPLRIRRSPDMTYDDMPTQ